MEGKTRTRYTRDVFCPVCKQQIDQISSFSLEQHGQSEALILNDSRRAHAFRSPACMRHSDWVHGWTFGPTREEEVPDAAP